MLVAEGDQKNFVGAFVVPNQPIAKNKSLVDYQVFGGGRLEACGKKMDG